MKKKILCTLGPASMNEKTIVRLEELNIDLFRINLSHTDTKDLPEIIDYIKGITKIPICIDTEGAQIRSGTIKNGSIKLTEHRTIKVVSEIIEGDEIQFNLYPNKIFKELIIGDLVSVDFDSVLLQVIDVHGDRVTFRILNAGVIGQNKAVTVNRPIKMPPLTEKDIASIKISREMGINHFALSFANQPEDIDFIRSFTGQEAFIISKIECRNGINNLNKIARKSNAILIDRGDLSREFPIERIPSLQKKIIEDCKKTETEVYVATNLLESMIKAPTPNRAEVNDVYTTLMSGADGLVLAAETAIGINPVACVNMIVKLIHSFETDLKENIEGVYYDAPKLLLIEPHGGELICRIEDEKHIHDAETLPQLQVSEVDLMDSEQIANGTYSPLSGFMDKKTLHSVLETNSLPNGVVWTMPIILQLPHQDTSSISLGNRIALTDYHGTIYATLDVTEIYKIDLESTAQKWFGTSSKKHPGVSMFMARGEKCIAGDITLLRRFYPKSGYYNLTPIQSRFLFNHKGWSKVVGFHSRNPVHRVHEYIQLSALSKVHADGLFINPVIGPKKAGDFLSEIIMRSYQILIENNVYPSQKIALGSFFTYSRYCGPRETLFTMLCRKNMGCSHFIVGRDHAGVGEFYKPEENKQFIESFDNLGIQPIFFEEIGYSHRKKGFVTIKNDKEIVMISGTEVREAIKNRNKLPDWFMRTQVQEMLHKEIDQGGVIFHH